MRVSLAVTYSRIVGGVLIALATMLGACVGQVDPGEEMVDEMEEALLVEQDEGMGHVDSPTVRAIPIVEDSDPDPDPQPWRPLSAVKPDARRRNPSSGLRAASASGTNP